MSLAVNELMVRIVAADGTIQTVSLAELQAGQIPAGAKLILIDPKTGQPVQGLIVRKDGDDLVLELEGEGEVARVENFYSVELAGEVTGGLTGVNAGSAPASDGDNVAGTGLSANEIALGVIGLGALGLVGAALANASDDDGPNAPAPEFDLLGLGGEGPGVSLLPMEAGDTLVAMFDGAGNVTGYELNGEPVVGDPLAAIFQANGDGGFFYDRRGEQGIKTDSGLYFDRMEVMGDGIHVTRDLGNGPLHFEVEHQEDLTAKIVGDMFFEADNMVVEFEDEATAGPGAFADLRSVTLTAESHAELEFSNDGAADFASALRSIHVEATGLPGSGTGDFGLAELDISASANTDSGGIGNGFMDNLQTIQVIGTENAEASLSISHSGSDNFMASLRSIRVESNGEDQSADVSISASGNRNMSAEPYKLGEHFMPSLETIHVVANDHSASLSLSHSGGEHFMESLHTIHVEGYDDSEFSLSASANKFNDTELTGTNFMASLETITVLSETRTASLSVSHSGGDFFMQSLTDIVVEGGGRAEISMSASATMTNFSGALAEPLFLPGNDFMAALETITVTSTAEGDSQKASLSISHDGGINFMKSLRTIEVSSDERAEISISASANTWIENEAGTATLLGLNFMPMLQSITLEGGSQRASLSVSHSGGADFMTSLRTISVTGDHDAGISISASANTFTDPSLQGNNFMPMLQTITISAGADNRGSLSLSHSGGIDFMTSLQSMNVTAGGNADISISASLNFTGATGTNFMSMLESITIAGLGGDRASLSISAEGQEMFMRSLETINVTGGDGRAEVDISMSIADVAQTGHSQAGNNAFGALTSITTGAVSNLAEVEIENEVGTAFMPMLTTITQSGEDSFLAMRGAMGKSSGTLTFDVTGVDGGDNPAVAFIQTQHADFGGGATTVLVTNIGASGLQYNAAFAALDASLGDGNFSDNFVQVYNDPADSQVAEGAMDIAAGDFAGFVGFDDGADNGWINLGSNGVKDLFTFNSTDFALGVIGGFDDGLDQFDFAALGAALSGAIADHSGAAAHVATAAGGVLVTQDGDDADNAIAWLNTSGGATASFDDFETAIVILDGSAMTWDGGDMLFSV